MTTIKILTDINALRFTPAWLDKLGDELIKGIKSSFGQDSILTGKWISQGDIQQLVLSIEKKQIQSDSDGMIIPFSMGTQTIPLMQVSGQGMAFSSSVPGVPNLAWSMAIQTSMEKNAKELWETAKKNGLWKFDLGDNS